MLKPRAGLDPGAFAHDRAVLDHRVLAHLDARREDRALDPRAVSDHAVRVQDRTDHDRALPDDRVSADHRVWADVSAGPYDRTRVDQDRALEVGGAVDLGVLVDADAASSTRLSTSVSTRPVRMSQLAWR